MDSNKKYSSIHLEAAENGFILRYSKRTESDRIGSYEDRYDYKSKELVFTDKEADKAFDKFKELHMHNKGIKKGSDKSKPKCDRCSCGN